MKKYFLLFSLLICLLFGVVGHAGEKILVITDSGAHIQENTLKVVRIDDDASKYPNEAKEAFLSHGKIVSVKEKKEFGVVGLFQYETATIRTLGIKYDDKENLVVSITEHEILESEKSFFFFPIFWSLALLLFFVGRKVRARYPFHSRAAFLAVIPITIAAASFTMTYVAIIAAISAAISAVISAAAMEDSDNMVDSKCHIYSTLFCVSMFLSFTAVYWPLLA